VHLFGGSPAWGQVSGNLSGIIRDPSGSVISGAKVTAENNDTGATRSTFTNDTGFYQLTSLPVGHYDVRVNASGFADEVRSGINLV